MIGYRPLLGIAALNPTYGLLRSPDAIREGFSRRLTHSPDCIRATGWLSVGCAARTTTFALGMHSLGGPPTPYGSGL